MSKFCAEEERIELDWRKNTGQASLHRGDTEASDLREREVNAVAEKGSHLEEHSAIVDYTVAGLNSHLEEHVEVAH